MKRPRRQPSAVVVALYVNALLLGGILLMLLGRNNSPNFLPAAYAAPMAQPIAGGGSIYLMPAQFSLNTFGCYLMDIDKQTLCAYQFKPGSTQLQFVASRQFTQDLRVKNFNTTPDPEVIKKMNAAQQQGVRGVFGQDQQNPPADGTNPPVPPTDPDNPAVPPQVSPQKPDEDTTATPPASEKPAVEPEKTTDGDK